MSHGFDLAPLLALVAIVVFDSVGCCAIAESVLGAQYGSALERQLEARLGGVRALRDTVAAAAGAWQAGARRAQRAHHAAAQALLAWQLVPHARYTYSLHSIIKRLSFQAVPCAM